MRTLKILKSAIALTLSIPAFAAQYTAYIPLEQFNGKSGALPTNSIVFIGNQNNPTFPTNPSPQPETPVIVQPPVVEQPKTRTPIAQYSFYEDTVNYQGYFNGSKTSKYYDNSAMQTFVIDTILEHNKTYYASNTGTDCTYTAWVCTMNVPREQGGCTITDKTLSGRKTLLNRVTSASCLSSSRANFASAYVDIKFYDEPKAK